MRIHTRSSRGGWAPIVSNRAVIVHPWSATTGTASAEFGTALAFVSDYDGNGRQELLVGSPHDENGGCIYLYFMNDDGLSWWNVVTIRREVSRSPPPWLEFGRAIAAAGPLNDGDSVSDIVVGSRDDKVLQGSGAIHVLLMMPATTDPRPQPPPLPGSPPPLAPHPSKSPPFVESSSGGSSGNPGQTSELTAEDPNLSLVWIIVISVVATLVVATAIALFAVFVKRRRKRKDDGLPSVISSNGVNVETVPAESPSEHEIPAVPIQLGTSDDTQLHLQGDVVPSHAGAQHGGPSVGAPEAEPSSYKLNYPAHTPHDLQTPAEGARTAREEGYQVNYAVHPPAQTIAPGHVSAEQNKRRQQRQLRRGGCSAVDGGMLSPHTSSPGLAERDVHGCVQLPTLDNSDSKRKKRQQRRVCGQLSSPSAAAGEPDAELHRI
jgi:hypothetical protein